MVYNNVMNFEKANWSADGDKIQFSVPLTKVDKERRLVSGFATLDNVDQHGDVVTAEASAKAFASSRRNLREMHAAVAVGKVVDFKEETFVDTKTGTPYQGIYVTAYVSRGAQDTWEKVLDGTLAGFSIGGNIKDSDEEWSKDAGRPIRFIKEYDLTELSLVDNPANQLANVFSILKSADGTQATGMATEIKTENVFYCETDGLAKASEDDAVDCSVCGEGMENIGWFEHERSNTSEMIAEAVRKHLHPEEHAEGGVIVSKEIKKSEEEAVEQTETAQVEEPTATEVEETSAAEETVVVEEAGEENDLVKVIDNFRATVEKKLSENDEAIQKAVTSLDEKFDEFSKSFEEKFEELSTKHSELTEKFAGLKEGFDGIEKSVETIESSTAVRKSGDLGGSTEETLEKSADGNKSFWGSAFLGE